MAKLIVFTWRTVVVLKKAMLAHEDKPLKPKFLAGTRVLTLKSLSLRIIHKLGVVDIDRKDTSPRVGEQRNMVTLCIDEGY